MQVKFGTSNDTFLCDLSGSELEVLHRIMAKAVRFSQQYIGDKQYNVHMGDTDFTATVLTKVNPLLMPEQYDAMRNAEAAKERAALVKEMIDDEDTDGKPLKDKLYYGDFIKYNDRDNWKLDEVGYHRNGKRCVVYVHNDGTKLSVDESGAVERIPAA